MDTSRQHMHGVKLTKNSVNTLHRAVIQLSNCSYIFIPFLE